MRLRRGALPELNECPFCKRIREGAYGDSDFHDVVWFEPLNPVTRGHLLFVHRLHTRAADAIPMVAGRVFEAAATFASHNAEDFNLITSSGADATQTVQHMHIHYVPRRPNDGLHLPWTGQK